MKAYHLKRTVADTRIDYLFIPEFEVFKGYIQEPKFRLIVSYSYKSFLDRAQAVIDGKPDEVQWEILDNIEIDKRTARKVSTGKTGFRDYQETAGTIENLIIILSEGAPKTLRELLDIRI